MRRLLTQNLPLSKLTGVTLDMIQADAGVGKAQVWLVNLPSKSAALHKVITQSYLHQSYLTPKEVRRHGFGLFLAFLVFCFITL